MSVKLTTRLSQRLVLTPQLRQCIGMLQMSSLELSDLIQQQLLKSPILEEVQTQDEKPEIEKEILDQLAGGPADDAPPFEAAPPESVNGNAPAATGVGDAQPVELLAAPEASEGEEAARAEDFAEEAEAVEHPRDSFDEIDFGREFQDYLDPGYKTQEFEYKEDAPTFEQFLTRAPSLAEHLEWQLHMDCAEGDLCNAAEAVIGNLDPDGRLNATNEEIAAQGGWSEETVERARQIVVKLEPVGCGTRDVRECLLVQLEARGETKRLANQLIRDHLQELQQHKLPHLSQQIGVDLETLAAELQFIRTLDPFPGRRYSSEEPILISPEIYIEKLEENGEYVIYFVDDGSKRLRISPSFHRMI